MRLHTSTRFRPKRSPNTPNTRPPSGRVMKPTAYVISDKSTAFRGSTVGKNTRSNTSAAADANTKKSYHSISEPIELEINSVREPAICGEVGLDRRSAEGPVSRTPVFDALNSNEGRSTSCAIESREAEVSRCHDRGRAGNRRAEECGVGSAHRTVRRRPLVDAGDGARDSRIATVRARSDWTIGEANSHGLAPGDEKTVGNRRFVLHAGEAPAVPDGNGRRGGPSGARARPPSARRRAGDRTGMAGRRHSIGFIRCRCRCRPLLREVRVSIAWARFV